MYLRHIGHSSFMIRSDSSFTVVTDPYDDSVGCPSMAGTQADLVTVSHRHYDHFALSMVKGDPTIVEGPCDMDFSGIHISSRNCFHDDRGGSLRGTCTVYKFLVDGITVCHMADIGEDYNAAIADFAKGSDILLIPVGGTYTIGAKSAVNYTREINPRIVVPMHYFFDGCTLNIEKPDKFLKEFKDVSRETHLEFSGSMPAGPTRAVLLEG